MTSRKKLTLDEFEKIRPHLARVESRKVEAVRRVLVEGVLQKNVAAEMKLSTVTISTLVSRAWQVHLDHGERPDGWVAVETVLPPEIADAVLELARIIRSKVKR